MKRGQGFDKSIQSRVLRRLENGERAESVAEQFGLSLSLVLTWAVPILPFTPLAAESIVFTAMDKETNRIQTENEKLKTRLSLLGVSF